MDQFLSDKVLNDPKYQEFKSVGKKLLKMMQDIEKEKNQKVPSDDKTISI